MSFRLVQIAYGAALVLIEVYTHFFSRALMAFVNGSDTARLWWLAGFGLALLVGWAARKAL